MSNCDICNKKIGLAKFKYKFKSGQIIDGECRKRLDLPDTVLKYKEDFNFCYDKVQEQLYHEDLAKEFRPTTKFGDKIAVNDEDRTFVVYPFKVPLSKISPVLFKYEELQSFDVIEDGNSVKGGIVRAAVGGMAFGGAGAIVGAATGKTKKTISEYKIKLNLNNLIQPYYILDISLNEIKKSSLLFKEYEKDMNDAIAGLQHVIDSKDDKKAPSSNLEDLRELKSLLDEKIITQEEFNAKKSQILGI